MLNILNMQKRQVKILKLNLVKYTVEKNINPPLDSNTLPKLLLILSFLISLDILFLYKKLIILKNNFLLNFLN